MCRLICSRAWKSPRAPMSSALTKIMPLILKVLSKDRFVQIADLLSSQQTKSFQRVCLSPMELWRWKKDRHGSQKESSIASASWIGSGRYQRAQNLKRRQWCEHDYGLGWAVNRSSWVFQHDSALETDPVRNRSAAFNLRFETESEWSNCTR